jgi:hypothetical protein
MFLGQDHANACGEPYTVGGRIPLDDFITKQNTDGRKAMVTPRRTTPNPNETVVEQPPAVQE